MKLKEVRVTNFRNFLDSGPVRIQDDITCLVGKNESGKTAFLHAVYRLKPARSNVSFSLQDHYPAWRQKRDRLQKVNLDEQVPVRAVFQLEEDDVTALEKQFGKGILKTREIAVKRQYNGKRVFGNIEFDERTAISHIISSNGLTSDVVNEVRACKTLKEVAALAGGYEERGKDDQIAREIAKTLNDRLRAMLGDDGDFRVALVNAIDRRMPEFFFYAEYSALPGTVDIGKLLRSTNGELTDDEHTAKALLRLASADDEYLLNPDYELRKRELENVANALTEDVLQYWSQNPELRVLIDITQKTVSDQRGQRSVMDEMKIRMYDQLHLLSLPFEERSRGFRWFFSFMAAFSEYEYSERPVVILLDEPALGLHARAQADFLRFIDDRLAGQCQVIYSTHSPFMVQPSNLERLRIVEDRGREEGAKVIEDINAADADTVFPIQSAMGYDMARHLFKARHNLVLERFSDYMYLTLFSEHLRKQDRPHLSPEWTLMPVGGAETLKAFTSLLSAEQNITVLLTTGDKGGEELDVLSSEHRLSDRNMLSVAEVLQREHADLEDLFAVADYVNLLKHALELEVQPQDVRGSGTIIQRIMQAKQLDAIDRSAPASYLLQHQAELLPALNKGTLERFELLFTRINATLEQGG
jgi:predicted ATP-dependent endonuclease of OLD family